MYVFWIIMDSFCDHLFILILFMYALINEIFTYIFLAP